MPQQRTTPQPVPQTGVQVVTVTQYPSNDGDCCSCYTTYDAYRSQSSIILGGLQIAVGLLCIILQIAGMAIQPNRRYYPNDTYNAGAAYWCAPFFIVAGVLAVISGQKKTGGPIIGNLVMSLVAAIMAFILMIVCAVIVSEENEQFSGYSFYYYYRPSRDSNDKGSYAIGILILILSLVELVVACWSSGLGCAVTCCGRPNNRGVRTTGGTAVIPAVHYTNTQSSTYYGSPQGAVVVGYPQPLQAGVVRTTTVPQPQPVVMQQPPQYYPPSAPPTYMAQQGPSEVHMPHPADGSAQANNPPAYK